MVPPSALSTGVVAVVPSRGVTHAGHTNTASPGAPQVSDAPRYGNARRPLPSVPSPGPVVISPEPAWKTRSYPTVMRASPGWSVTSTST